MHLRRWKVHFGNLKPRNNYHCPRNRLSSTCIHWGQGSSLRHATPHTSKGARVHKLKHPATHLIQPALNITDDRNEHSRQIDQLLCKGQLGGEETVAGFKKNKKTKKPFWTLSFCHLYTVLVREVRAGWGWRGWLAGCCLRPPVYIGHTTCSQPFLGLKKKLLVMCIHITIAHTPNIDRHRDICSHSSL